MDKMDKEQYASYKKLFLEEKQKAYEAAGVCRLIQTKRCIWRILAVFWVVHFILSAIASAQMQLNLNYGIQTVKALIQLFMLYLFISPEGSWRINIMLYVSAAYNLGMILTEYQRSLQDIPLQDIPLQDILLQIFQQFPVLGLTLLMEILIPFLFLGAAVYLTIPKSHREQAETVQAILKKMQEDYKNKMNIN